MRRRFLAVLAIAIATLVAAFVTPTASATPTSGKTPAAITSAPALATATTTTKSCGTGGYSYQTDSMYVVRSQYDSNTWKYVVTHSANRTTYDSSGHSYRHTAAYLHVYFSSSSMTTITYPPTPYNVYSGSPYTDFRLVESIVVDGGTHSYYMSCDVKF